MTVEVPLRGAYSREHAAEYLDCSTETLRQYVRDGLIAAKGHGKKPVFLRADLDRLLENLPEHQK